MTTIQDLAHEYGAQPYELTALLGEEFTQTQELTPEQEAYARDVIERTDGSGVYH